MIFDRATIDDVKELTALRISYLREDSGEMEEETLRAVEAGLPDYFMRHLNGDLAAYVARADGEVAACALLLVIEKPMSPAFPTGRTGAVLNVYTKPEYRRRGCARRLMELLLRDAADRNLSFVELKATEDGYGLYRSLGFADEVSKYHSMRWYQQVER